MIQKFCTGDILNFNFTTMHGFLVIFYFIFFPNLQYYTSYPKNTAYFVYVVDKYILTWDNPLNVVNLRVLVNYV